MLSGTPTKLALATISAVLLLLLLLAFLLLGNGVSWDVSLPTSDSTGASGAVDSVVEPRGVDDIVRDGVSRKDAGVQTRLAVEGRVRDALGTPLAGVGVTSRQLDEPLVASASSQTTTDALGRFALSLPNSDPAELAFCNSGYRPHRETVRAPSIHLDVVLDRSPMLRGRVVRPNGTSVGGALVRWSNQHLALGAGETTTTGNDGRFGFVDLPWVVDLQIVPQGALPVDIFVRVTWNMPDLVVTVDEGREATGTILDAGSRAGIAGASVELWYYQSTYTIEGRRDGPALHTETVTTLADGGFTLTKLPSAADKQLPRACLWVTAPGRAPNWKIVDAPERADKLEVTLYPAGSVRGRVVDASGVPVPEQRVYAEAQAQPLCDAGPNLAYRLQDGGYGIMWNTRRPEVVAPFQAERQAFTDSRGAYVIDGIPCPVDGGEVTIALPSGDPHATVVAQPGEVAVAKDIVLPDGLFRRWHGVVCDENKSPVAGVTIDIGGHRTIADAQGRFDFEVPGNVQGPQTLRASAPGYVSVGRVFVPTGGIFAECDDGGVTITLVRGLRLEITVVDRSRRPVPNVSVQFFPEGGLAEFAKGGHRPIALGSAFSDDRGAMLLEGVPDTCDLLVECPFAYTSTHRRVLEGVAAGTLRVTLEDLDVSAGTASLTVRTIDGRTDAAIGGPVLVEALSEKVTRRLVAQGPEIRLDDLPFGTWDVSVATEGLGGQSVHVQLIADQRLEVRLGQGASISGRLTCASGPLARSVQVSAREIATKRLSVTRTDAAGCFAFAGMVPGE